MDTQIGERRNLAPEANQDELLVEQRRRERPVLEILHPAHRVPAPPQRPMQPRLARDIEVDIRWPGRHGAIVDRCMGRNGYGGSRWSRISLVHGTRVSPSRLCHPIV